MRLCFSCYVHFSLTISALRWRNALAKRANRLQIGIRMQLFSHTLSIGLIKLRKNAPLVQNITNLNAMDFSANALLALGAAPAMIHAHEEVADFIRVAKSLVINIGTISGPWSVSMLQAASMAHERKTPWVLDPAWAGRTEFRNRIIGELLAFRPTIIRGNASEIIATRDIAAGNPTVQEGNFEANRSMEEGIEAARQLAKGLGCVVVVSGAVDAITDGTDLIRLTNGHPMMTKVTAMGCVLSAVIGAIAAVEPNPMIAAAIGTGAVSIFGEIAADNAQGPASFRTSFIDLMYALDPNIAMRRLKILN